MAAAALRSRILVEIGDDNARSLAGEKQRPSPGRSRWPLRSRSRVCPGRRMRGLRGAAQSSLTLMLRNSIRQPSASTPMYPRGTWQGRHLAWSRRR